MLSTLQACIKSTGKTLDEIQEDTGIHRTQLSRYATGRDPIRTKHLLKLSDYFKVNPQDLLQECPVVVV